MEFLHVFLIAVFISTSFVSAGEPREQKPNEWVKLTKNLIALSAGAYVFYKVVDNKAVANKLIDFVQKANPRAPIADFSDVADVV